VLLVDGLDEDRGVTTGPDAHSIAALLPARPGAGLRVVVAGRPHPPVPADVPGHHPLHDPGIVRTLERSSFAETIRVEAQRELKHLLAGPETERELLGLLTASGGGLATTDLAELTDRNLYEIEEILRSRAGRTFLARENSSRPHQSPVFVLGHEELLSQAIRMLGPRALDSYRDRVHAWARTYADARWPQETPDYLVRGYISMLRGASDLTRMTAVAADSARHDRLRELTGGDAAALAEIDLAQRLLAEEGVPNLFDLLLLAVRRDALNARNEHIPPGLPAVWVGLGQPRRAEALARSLKAPRRRAEALAAVGTALAEAGSAADAVSVFEEAACDAHACRDPLDRARALVEIARAWWAVEHHGATAALRGAEDVAATMRSFPTGPIAYIDVAEGWAATGDHDRARGALAQALALTGTDSLAEPWQRADVRARVGRMLHAWGEAERAEELWAQNEELANVTADDESCYPLMSVAYALRDLPGQSDRIDELYTRAEARARLADNDWALLQIGILLSASGAAEHAERIARGITEEAQLLSFVSADLAKCGELTQAETLARPLDDPQDRGRALTAMATSLLARGRHADARSLAVEVETRAREAVDPLDRARSLINLGENLTVTGEHRLALTLFDEAEVLVREHVPPEGDWVWHHLGNALIEAGELQRAEALARSQAVPLWRVRLLTLLGRALAATSGTPARALTVLGEAATAAASITDRHYQAYELADVATALVAAGAYDRAEELARSIEYPGSYGNPALVQVGTALGVQGQEARGSTLLEECEREIRNLSDLDSRVWRLTSLAEGLIACGELAKAAGLLAEVEHDARHITDPRELASALTGLAEALIAFGDRARAQSAIARTVEVQLTWPDQNAFNRDRDLAHIGVAFVTAGAHHQAESLLDAIDDPGRQAQVYIALAKAAAPDRARRLIARCLCAAPWRHALDGLVETDPQLLVRLAVEEFRAGHDG
jgi:tetratricopeptide (TPR) repeat protein